MKGTAIGAGMQHAWWSAYSIKRGGGENKREQVSKEPPSCLAWYGATIVVCVFCCASVRIARVFWKEREML